MNTPLIIATVIIAAIFAITPLAILSELKQVRKLLEKIATGE